MVIFYSPYVFNNPFKVTFTSYLNIHLRIVWWEEKGAVSKSAKNGAI